MHRWNVSERAGKHVIGLLVGRKQLALTEDRSKTSTCLHEGIWAVAKDWVHFIYARAVFTVRQPQSSLQFGEVYRFVGVRTTAAGHVV